MFLFHFPADRSALFLDTSAGFQVNAEQIGTNAVENFQKRVGYRLEIVSCKSSETFSLVDAAAAYRKLRGADYILMGPSNPTYAVWQLSQSRIPEIFIDHIRKGGCLVVASAAALTAGRITLPVHEIYKVDQAAPLGCRPRFFQYTGQNQAGIQETVKDRGRSIGGGT